MYALIIRPQQKKAKEHDALLKKLKIGDKVSTASGILVEAKPDNVIISSVLATRVDTAPGNWC